MRRDFGRGVLKPLSVERHNRFIIDIMSHHSWDAFLSWAYTDLVYLLSQELEAASEGPQVKDIIQANPIILKELKTTVQQMTAKHLKSQLAPQLFVYYRNHPEVRNNPIYIHQHQQVLRLIKQQQETLKQTNEVPVWQTEGIIPVVSKSELRQSGKRKSIQTLIKLIRSIETYYTDNNEHRDDTQPQFIDLHNKKITTALYKHLNHTLIQNYASHSDPQLKAAVNKLVIENTFNRHTQFAKRVGKQESNASKQPTVKLTSFLEEAEPLIAPKVHLADENSHEKLHKKPLVATLAPKDKQALLEKMVRFYVKPQTGKDESNVNKFELVQNKPLNKRFNIEKYDVLQKLELLLLPAIEHTRKSHEGKSLERVSQSYRQTVNKRSTSKNIDRLKQNYEVTHEQSRKQTKNLEFMVLKQLLESRKVTANASTFNRYNEQTKLVPMRLKLADDRRIVKLDERVVEPSHDLTHDQLLHTSHEETRHQEILAIKKLLESRKVTSHTNREQVSKTMTSARTLTALKQLQLRLQKSNTRTFNRYNELTKLVPMRLKLVDDRRIVKQDERVVEPSHDLTHDELLHTSHEETKLHEILAIKQLLESRNITSHTDREQVSKTMISPRTLTALKQLQLRLQKSNTSTVNRYNEHNKLVPMRLKLAADRRIVKLDESVVEPSHDLTHDQMLHTSRDKTRHQELLAIKQLLESRKVTSHTYREQVSKTMTSARTLTALKQLQLRLQKSNTRTFNRYNEQNKLVPMRLKLAADRRVVEQYERVVEPSHDLTHDELLHTSHEETRHQEILAIKQLLESRKVTSHTNREQVSKTMTSARTLTALKQLQLRLQKSNTSTVNRYNEQTKLVPMRLKLAADRKVIEPSHEVTHNQLLHTSHEETKLQEVLAIKQLLESHKVTSHANREQGSKTITSARTLMALKQLQLRLQKSNTRTFNRYNEQTKLVPMRLKLADDSRIVKQSESHVEPSSELTHNQLLHTSHEKTKLQELLAIKQLLESRKVTSHTNREQVSKTMTSARTLTALKQLQLRLQKSNTSTFNRYSELNKLVPMRLKLAADRGGVEQSESHVEPLNELTHNQLPNKFHEETRLQELLAIKQLLESRNITSHTSREQVSKTMTNARTLTALKQLQHRLQKSNTSTFNRYSELNKLVPMRLKLAVDRRIVELDESVVEPTSELTHNQLPNKSHEETRLQELLSIKQLLESRKVTSHTNREQVSKTMTSARTLTALKQLQLRLQKSNASKVNRYNEQTMLVPMRLKLADDGRIVEPSHDLTHDELLYTSHVDTRHQEILAIKQLLESRKVTSHTYREQVSKNMTSTRTLTALKQLQLRLQKSNATTFNRYTEQTKLVSMRLKLADGRRIVEQSESHVEPSSELTHNQLLHTSHEETRLQEILAIKQLLESHKVTPHKTSEQVSKTMTSAQVLTALKQLQHKLQKSNASIFNHYNEQIKLVPLQLKLPADRRIVEPSHELTHDELLYTSYEETKLQELLSIKQLLESRKATTYTNREQVSKTMTSPRTLTALKQLQLKLQKSNTSTVNRYIEQTKLVPLQLKLPADRRIVEPSRMIAKQSESHVKPSRELTHDQLLHVSHEETKLQEILAIKQQQESRKATTHTNREHAYKTMTSARTLTALKQLQLGLQHMVEHSKEAGVGFENNLLNTQISHSSTNTFNRYNEQTKRYPKLLKLAEGETNLEHMREATHETVHVTSNGTTHKQISKTMTSAHTRNALHQLQQRLHQTTEQSKTINYENNVLNMEESGRGEQLAKPLLKFKQEVQVREIIRQVIRDVETENVKNETRIMPQSELIGNEYLQMPESTLPTDGYISNKPQPVDVDAVVDQIFNKVMQKIERERRRRGM